MPLFAAFLLCFSAIACADWFPIEVNADGKPVQYLPQTKASKAWRVCALLPQGNDKFWWGVSWGLAQEAERQDITLGIYQAGGYENTHRQAQQFDECLARKANAIIVAAIDGQSLSSRIGIAAQRGIPVIDLTNNLHLKQISAHVYSDTGKMVAMAASHILALSANTIPTVAWLPGPKTSNWVINAEKIALAMLSPPRARLVHGGYGVTDANTQMTLVRKLLGKQLPDYLLANAVAADLASRYVKFELKKPLPIIAYYSNPETIKLLREGRIEAVVTSSPVIEARISIDLAIRILEKQPYHHTVNPPLTLLTRQTLPGYPLRQSLAPDGQWFIAKPLPMPGK